MLTLQAILPLIPEQAWMASIDLKDAYFHVTIWPQHCWYLRFAVGKDHYQYRILPFGISTAPQVFTKCMAVVAVASHLEGILVFPYIDDWLVVARTAHQLCSALQRTVALLSKLGLCINMQKSASIPAQSLQFIGARIDTIVQRAFLPTKRADAICQLIKAFLHHNIQPALHIQRLLGLMAATTFVVPLARLRMRPLQLWFLHRFSVQTQPQCLLLRVPKKVIKSLTWWTVPGNLAEGLPFLPQEPEVLIYTGASLWGWGAHYGELHAQGRWPKSLSQCHINMLELTAVQNALLSFLPAVRGKDVQVATDSMAMKYYLNKQGGTGSRALCKLLMSLWDWCVHNRVWISAIHIPGELNTRANALSRTELVEHEWSINNRYLHPVFKAWEVPTLDAFATSENAKCHLFFTRGQPRKDFAGDAFLHRWTGRTFYMFPPLPLIPRVISKIIRDQTSCILLTPWWPWQPWFATLLCLSKRTYLRFPRVPDLLSQQRGALS